ncbi:MAG TPA: SURF1 family cytochrome oxidase biogenesis protein [Caulobacteraceae bacterium]
MAVACVAFAILVGLGAWQFHRLEWKQDLLARIAALRRAPAASLQAALSAGRGNSAEFRRVSVACLPPPRPSPMIFRYALRQGQVAWRSLIFCHLAERQYDGILLDRGIVSRSTGLMAPRAERFAEPSAAVGILRSPGGKPWLDSSALRGEHGIVEARLIDGQSLLAMARMSGVSRPAPYVVAVEAENPAPQGISPAALPQDIPNNHFAYALTWFGLAAGLAWVAGGLVRRRLAAA